MIIFRQKTLQRKIDLAVASRVTAFKSDIKELKKQVGYWVCGEEGGIFFTFTMNKPAKPEFSVAEKIDAILDHLDLEVNRIEEKEQIKLVPKEQREPRVITYKKRGLKVGGK